MSAQPLTMLAEEETIFRQQVLAFAQQRLAPRVREMDEGMALDPEIVRMCFDLGLMGIEIPEEYSGSSSSFFNSVLAIETLATVDASLAVMVDVHNTLVNTAIMRWGTEEQKERYLPRLATEWVGAYALSEASSGSDAFALKCRARRQGQDWILEGSKLWITNAREAGLFIVLANADPAAGYKGITAFLVERGAPGFTIGTKEHKLGIRASSTCELVFEDCVVPGANVLGQVGQGYKVAIETLNEGRIGIGAQMVGIAQGAFDQAMAYMRERTQFDTRICDFQGVQFQYADLATEIEAARLLVYNAARLREAGQPFLTQAAMAKLYSSQVAERVASRCLDFFAGVGYTKEYPAEKYYRDAKIGQIYEGTSNMQRLTIAKQVLKGYGG